MELAREELNSQHTSVQAKAVRLEAMEADAAAAQAQAARCAIPAPMHLPEIDSTVSSVSLRALMYRRNAVQTARLISRGVLIPLTGMQRLCGNCTSQKGHMPNNYRVLAL